MFWLSFPSPIHTLVGKQIWKQQLRMLSPHIASQAAPETYRIVWRNKHTPRSSLALPGPQTSKIRSSPTSLGPCFPADTWAGEGEEVWCAA